MAAFQVDLGERSKRACFTMARILAEELSHFVIEDGARRIVVDTCVGISKDRPQIPEFDTSIDRFSPTLLQRASPPDAVDTVWVPRTVSWRLTSAFANQPTSRSWSAAAQHDRLLWPSDSPICCSPAC